MVRVAVAEVEGVVLLDGDRGAELDVLGLVGDAEAARADHALDAVAAVENGIDRQSQATVHDTFPIGLLASDLSKKIGPPKPTAKLRARTPPQRRQPIGRNVVDRAGTSDGHAAEKSRVRTRAVEVPLPGVAPPCKLLADGRAVAPEPRPPSLEARSIIGLRRSERGHPYRVAIPRVIEQHVEIAIFDLAKDKLSRALPHGG